MEPSDRSPRLRDILAISSDPRFLLSIALWRPVSALYGRFVPESLEATLRTAGFASFHVSETLSGLGLCALVEGYWLAAESELRQRGDTGREHPTPQREEWP